MYTDTQLCPAAARARRLPSGSDSEERLSWQKQISKQPSQAVRRRLSFSPPLSYNFIPSLAISFCPYGEREPRASESGAACVYYCERAAAAALFLCLPRRALNPEKSHFAPASSAPRRRGRGEKTLFTLIFARAARCNNNSLPLSVLFLMCALPSPQARPFFKSAPANPPSFLPSAFFPFGRGRRKKLWRRIERVGARVASQLECMQPAETDQLLWLRESVCVRPALWLWESGSGACY